MTGNAFTLGVDIGSTASKAVVLHEGTAIVSMSVVPVGAGTTGPARAVAGALAEAGKRIEEMRCVCSTGYGRNSLPNADFEVSELSCHAKGAFALFPDVRTVIDIGGQDAKVIRVGAAGRLLNFVMNDKCAAGTGRFLEVMARALEVNVSELEIMDEKSINQISISSTCTVFAESEVISHLSKQVAIEDIVAGIHRSVAGRAIGLAKRAGVEEAVVMTGGVALNAGVVRGLERGLGVTIHTSPRAQLLGALGAAIFAYERVSESMRNNQ